MHCFNFIKGKCDKDDCSFAHLSAEVVKEMQRATKAKAAAKAKAEPKAKAKAKANPVLGRPVPYPTLGEFIAPQVMNRLGGFAAPQA